MEQLSFQDLQWFSRMAVAGSLSAVAREQGVAVTTVLRALARMERACGAKLFLRSRHGLWLTPEGHSFLRGCEQAAQALETLRGGGGQRGQAVSGHVRVSASAIVAEHWLVPSLPALHRAHPLLTVELVVDDAPVDLDRANVDLAIRAGAVRRQEWASRRLGYIDTALYVSPLGLGACSPDDVAAIEALPRLGHGGHSSLNVWQLADGRTWQASGPFRASTTSVLGAMAVQGLGVVCLPRLAAQTAVRQGLLVQVLDGLFVSHRVPVQALFSPQARDVARVRACLSHWVQWFHRGTVDNPFPCNEFGMVKGPHGYAQTG